MTKAKASATIKTSTDAVQSASSSPVSHDTNSAAYHQAQLDRVGAGACDICGKPVDAKPEWTKTSSCTATFHAEQAAQFGAGACSVCGHNVVN
jgi:hypothetical protein